MRFRLTHVPALDGLRGLAVIGVLAFHGGYLTGGYLGVDLFFVLSGFLITSLLLREHGEQGSVHLPGFWRRRARRLLPALFVLVALVALFAWRVAAPHELAGIRADGLWTLLYGANWHAITSGSGYWDLFNAPSPFEHTWSLAIEEQFYLLWPLALLGLLALTRGRRGPLAIVCGLLAAGLAAWALALYASTGDASRVYLGTDTRAPAILIGATLAVALARWGHVPDGRRRVALEVAAGVAVLGLAAAWVLVSGRADALYRGVLPACGLAVAIVIAAAVHPTPGPLARLLAWRPLAAVGLVSYGLYLYHWPVFVWFRYERIGSGAWQFAGAVAVSAALAVASYLLVERGVRRGGLAALPRPALAPVLAVASVLALVLATAGAVARPGASMPGDLAGAEPAPLPTVAPVAGTAAPPAGATPAGTDPVVAAAAPVAPVDAPATAPGDGGAPAPDAAGPDATIAQPATGPAPRAAGRATRVLVVGDSVAGGFADALAARAGREGLVVGNRAQYGCEVVAGDGRRLSEDGSIDAEPATCVPWRQRWASDVATFAPDVVVVLWGGALFGKRWIGGDWRGYCDAPMQTALRDAYDRALGTFGATGAAVFLTVPAMPDFPFLPPEVTANHECEARVVRAVGSAHPGVRLVRLDEWTCPPGQGCPEERDGVRLRDDGVHYDRASGGLDLATDWLLSQVLAGTAPTRAAGRR